MTIRIDPRPDACPSCGSRSRLLLHRPCSLDQFDPDAWHTFSLAQPMCVHSDGTEHPAEPDADGMYTTCDAVEEVEPTVESVVGLLSDAVALLDGAAVQLAELLAVERERRTDALDLVWQAWALAERGRGLLVPVSGT